MIAEVAPTQGVDIARQNSVLRTVRKLGEPVAANAQKINQVSQDFEAMFLSEMFSHMFSGIDTNPVFGGGYAEDVWRSMLTEQYGKSVSRAGGIGVAEYVKKQMLAWQEVSHANPE